MHIYMHMSMYMEYMCACPCPCPWTQTCACARERHLHELIEATLALPPRSPTARATARHGVTSHAIRRVLIPIALGGALGQGIGHRVALRSKPPPRRCEAPRAQTPRLRPARPRPARPRCCERARAWPQLVLVRTTTRSYWRCARASSTSPPCSCDWLPQCARARPAVATPSVGG